VQRGMVFYAIALACLTCISGAWAAPETFTLGKGTAPTRIWGQAPQPFVRHYSKEFLPALFERKVAFDRLDLEGDAFEWMFTGAHGGFTVRLTNQAVIVQQRYYDSYGLNPIESEEPKQGRHPEKQWRTAEARLVAPPKSLTVVLDHKLGLTVLADGEAVLNQECGLDVSRHQLRCTGENGRIEGRIESPAVRAASLTLDATVAHQTMIGFGGIGTPTAYRELSEEGKRAWWELVAEYNLLVQREYPNGPRLKPDLSNFDDLDDATPHYYGDNFPNGEISDFGYNRTIRKLGGMVWFEFWNLPAWACRDQNNSKDEARGLPDIDEYCRAMVGYCQIAREKAGAPPDVVGIQNERHQPAEVWHEMTLSLRRALNDAGFKDVKIHMSDSSYLYSGIETLDAFRRSEAAWAAIDYSATHMYDFQDFFTRPDEYDPLLLEWRGKAGGKPFLSTEMCINRSSLQKPEYRVAFTMGQLYHKNLAIADAAALCYCWTLLNVEQPSYGWTRTLFVPDRAHNFTPTTSSYQARVFGAFSRRIRKGMTRIGAKTDADGLLATAFTNAEGDCTAVVVNTNTAPVRVRIEQAPMHFTEMELTDPYHENAVIPLPEHREDLTPLVPPGGIVTVTNVPLRQLPPGFAWN